MLNPALDLDNAAAAFARDGRVFVPDILEPSAAEALHRCLEIEVPWGLTYRRDGNPVIEHADRLAQATPADWTDIQRQVEGAARQGFAFLYSTYMMVTAYKERRDAGLLLNRVVEYLNSSEFLAAMTRITGIATLRKANAQATRYLPGHFLRRHNDSSSEAREVAYVINLSRDWQADWGGLLHFTDEQGRAEDTYFPEFNSLSLFRVPAWHYVSQVASFATRPRYAITGWILSR